MWLHTSVHIYLASSLTCQEGRRSYTRRTETVSEHWQLLFYVNSKKEWKTLKKPTSFLLYNILKIVSIKGMHFGHQHKHTHITHTSHHKEMLANRQRTKLTHKNFGCPRPTEYKLCTIYRHLLIVICNLPPHWFYCTCIVVCHIYKKKQSSMTHTHTRSHTHTHTHTHT